MNYIRLDITLPAIEKQSMKPQDDDLARMQSSRQDPPLRNTTAAGTSTLCEQHTATTHIHIPGQRTSATDGDHLGCNLPGHDYGHGRITRPLCVAARALLFNLLTDETDTERQHLHTNVLQLSHGPGNYLRLVVMLLNSLYYCLTAMFYDEDFPSQLWLLQDISLPPVLPRQLARPLDTTKARIARRRSQVVLIRAV